MPKRTPERMPPDGAGARRRPRTAPPPLTFTAPPPIAFDPIPMWRVRGSGRAALTAALAFVVLLAAGAAAAAVGPASGLFGGDGHRRVHRALPGTHASTRVQAPRLIPPAAPPPPRFASGRVKQLDSAADAAARELAGSGDFSAVSWDESTGLWDRQPFPPGASWTWNPPAWWQSALAVSSLVDYLQTTRNTAPQYQNLLDAVFDENIDKPGTNEPYNFENRFMDDTAWWGLAWLDAARYELSVRHDRTDARRFVAAAETIAGYIKAQPATCRPAGIPFAAGHAPNSITDSEFIALAAGLARVRQPAGPLHDARLARRWLHDAQYALHQVRMAKFVNFATGAVAYGEQPGRTRHCQTVGRPQVNTEGEMADALVQLGLAAHHSYLIRDAGRIIGYVFSSHSSLINHGVLQEPCEAGKRHCGSQSDNVTVFKGIMDRAVLDYAQATGSPFDDAFLAAQAKAVLAHAASDGTRASHCRMAESCQLGMYWSQTFRPSRQSQPMNAGSQAAGLEALTSALAVLQAPSPS